MKSFYNLCVISIVVSVTTAKPNDSKWMWLNHLLDEISEIHHPHQILFITNGPRVNPSPTYCEFISRIMQRHSTIIYREDRLNLVTADMVYHNPRKTTFFIIFHQQNVKFRSKFQKYKKFWNQLGGANMRPKILLVLQREHKPGSYETYIKSQWELNYLDITLVEYKSVDHFVYQFNPFTEQFTKTPFNTSIVWFPDKLKDLHGANISIGFRRNMGKRIKNCNSEFKKLPGGTFVNIAKTLSKLMKFRIDAKCFQSEYSKSVSTALLDRTFDLICNFSPLHLFKDNRNSRVSNSMFIRMQTEFIIVPVKRLKVFKLPTSFLAFIFVSVSTVTVIYVWSRIINFDSRFWYFYNILTWFLGISARMPHVTSERVMVSFILIASIVQVGEFVEKNTKFNVMEYDVLKMDTFEDLDKSALVPRISPKYFQRLHNRNTTTIRSLMKKSRGGASENCVQYLIKNGNASCVVSNFQASSVFEIFRKVDGRPLLKSLGDDSVNMDWLVLPLHRNSPYVDRINEIIRSLIEYGFITLWEKERENDIHKMNEIKYDKFFMKNIINLYDNIIDETEDSSPLLYSVLFIYALGTVTSVIIFIFEIICSFSWAVKLMSFRKTDFISLSRELKCKWPWNFTFQQPKNRNLMQRISKFIALKRTLFNNKVHDIVFADVIKLRNNYLNTK